MELGRWTRLGFRLKRETQTMSPRVECLAHCGARKTLWVKAAGVALSWGVRRGLLFFLLF